MVFSLDSFFNHSKYWWYAVGKLLCGARQEVMKQLFKVD